MIFKEQIEKRREQEQKTLRESFENLADALGVGKKFVPRAQGDDDAYRTVLNEMGVPDAELNPLEGDLQEQFEAILRRNNIMYRQITLDKHWWKDSTGIILTHLKSGELIALQPGVWSGYYFKHPASGKKIWLNAEVHKQLSSQAYFFYPALPSRPLGYKDLLQLASRSLAVSDWIYILVACLIVSLFGMLTPYMNKQIFNNLIPSGSQEDILPIAGLLIGASVGSVLFSVTRSLVLARVKDKIDVFAQSAIMSRVFNLPIKFFRSYSSGDLSNRIMSFSSICTLLSDQVISSILTTLFSLVYLYQIFIYAKALLLPSILILTGILVLLLLTYRVEVKYQNKILSANSRLVGLVFSIFSGVQKLKLAGAETRIFKKWTDAYKDNVRLEAHPPILLRMNSALSGLCTLGSTGLIFYYTIKNEIGVSDYIAFNSAFGLISGALVSLFMLIPFLAQLVPMYQLMKPVMEAEPETGTESTQVSHLSGGIEVMNLSFRYDTKGPFILDNFNLSVKPGEYVGIVGTSGCGKSTLFRLLLGFETPERGAIVYDHYDLSKVDKRSLRRCIGTCLQNGKLFPGDIFSNITVTSPWSTPDDAWEAACLAGCADEIAAMPMNLFTLISEAGGGISGGQKQRILIARALVNKPSILLFDEATSALDNVTQQQITENLDKLGCTRLVIAHRLSTIKHCDRIIFLDKGKIAEEGTFEELIARRGLFYEMSKRQLNNEERENEKAD